MAEDIVDKAYAEGKIQAITLRPYGVFGPGESNLFPRLLQHLQSGKWLIFGDGSNVIELTFIENLVDAALLAAEASTQASGTLASIIITAAKAKNTT